MRLAFYDFYHAENVGSRRHSEYSTRYNPHICTYDYFLLKLPPTDRYPTISLKRLVYFAENRAAHDDSVPKRCGRRPFYDFVRNSVTRFTYTLYTGVCYMHLL